MKLEYNAKQVQDNGNLGNGVMVTPQINEEYWLIRVPLSDNQAIVCFPKFGTIGVGFQREDDWNTNLPYTCHADEIFRHISHNKGDDAIKDSDCLAAIAAIQDELKRHLQ